MAERLLVVDAMGRRLPGVDQPRRPVGNDEQRVGRSMRWADVYVCMLAEFARKKAEALLAFLALHPGQMHARDKLAALLWGDVSDERARHSLRQVLLTLRQARSIGNAPCGGVIAWMSAKTLWRHARRSAGVAP